MTVDDDFGGDATSDLVEGEQDSPVIQKLRETLKAKDRELKEVKSKAEGLEKTFEESRNASVKELVNDLGFPGLAEIVAEKIEGVPSKDAVVSVLAGLGLTPKAEGEIMIEPDKPASAAQSVEAAASLGQRVGDAARGGGSVTLKERLDAAKDGDEVFAIMAEAGLTQSS